MRRLVTPFSASNEPGLIVRRHVMLLNFDPMRAVILRDRLLVIVPDGADSILAQLEKRVWGGAMEMERSFLGGTTHGSEDDDMTTSEHSRGSGFRRRGRKFGASSSGGNSRHVKKNGRDESPFRPNSHSQSDGVSEAGTEATPSDWE